MRFLKGFRRRLHAYFLSKELNTHQINHHSVDFESAKWIGILFDATELEEREIVLNYANQLKKAGKKVKLLAYLNSNQESTNFSFHHFNRKNIDWVIRPKGQEVEQFVRQSFDILINLSRHANLSLDYIAALSHAKFRIGPFHNQLKSYELMIEGPVSRSLKDFIQEVIFFLQKTKTTSYAA